MERTGFVERAAYSGDRRVIRLRLTERGEAVVEAVVTAWAEVEGSAVTGLTPAGVDQLTRLLNLVRDNLA